MKGRRGRPPAYWTKVLFSAQRQYVALMAELERTKRDVGDTRARIELLTRSIGILSEGPTRDERAIVRASA